MKSLKIFGEMMVSAFNNILRPLKRYLMRRYATGWYSYVTFRTEGVNGLRVNIIGGIAGPFLTKKEALCAIPEVKINDTSKEREVQTRFHLTHPFRFAGIIVPKE